MMIRYETYRFVHRVQFTLKASQFKIMHNIAKSVYLGTNVIEGNGGLISNSVISLLEMQTR